jgi:hypothetical protein
MKLLEDLTKRRATAVEQRDEYDAVVVKWIHKATDVRDLIADLDRAIAALEPADPTAVAIAAYIEAENAPIPEPETQTGDDGHMLSDYVIDRIIGDRDDDHGPEQGDETLGDELDEPDDASEFAEPDDEATRAAAIELTADVEPVADDDSAYAVIHYPDGSRYAGEVNEHGEPHGYGVMTGPASEPPIPEPVWNEPQPTEGYAPVVDAPVTNPEADALAKAHDYYSPEKVAERNRFNPWGGVSHLFGKPKVDA